MRSGGNEVAMEREGRGGFVRALGVMIILVVNLEHNILGSASRIFIDILFCFHPLTPSLKKKKDGIGLKLKTMMHIH